MNDLLKILLTLSLSGGALALLVFTLRPLLRRVPTLRYYLCLIVLFRLILPFAPEGSLMNRALDRAEAQPPAEVHAAQQSPSAQVSIPAPQTIAPEAAPRQAETSTALSQQIVPAPQPIPWQDYLVPLWLLGALAVLLRAVVGLYLFECRMCLTARKASAAQQAALSQLCGRRRPLRLLRSTMVHSPVTIGLLRPRILLPMREYQKAELDTILRHELIHIARFDIAYKWFSLIVGAVHWFNPLVWLLRREIDIACELSCDAAVAAVLDAEGRTAYCKTLLRAAAPERFPLPRVGLGGEGRALRERLSMIMTHRRASKGLRMAGALCAVLLCVAAAALGCAGLPVRAAAQQGIRQRIGLSMSAQDEAAVRELLDGWVQSYKNGDTAAQLAHMSAELQQKQQGGAMADTLADGQYTITDCLIVGNGTEEIGVEATLYYTLSTDEPALYFVTEHLFIDKVQDAWTVQFDSATSYFEIDSPDLLAHVGLDYDSPGEITKAPQLTDAQLDLAQQRADAGDVRYTDLQKAGANFLHLTGGFSHAMDNTVYYFWPGGYALSMEMSQPRTQGAGGIWTVDSVSLRPLAYAPVEAAEIVRHGTSHQLDTQFEGLCPQPEDGIRYLFRVTAEGGERYYAVDAHTGVLTEVQMSARTHPVTGETQTEVVHSAVPTDAAHRWEGRFSVLLENASEVELNLIYAEGAPGQQGSQRLWYQYGEGVFCEAVISGNTAYDEKNDVSLVHYDAQDASDRRMEMLRMGQKYRVIEQWRWPPKSAAEVREMLALKLSLRHAGDESLRLSVGEDYNLKDKEEYFKFTESSATTSYAYLYEKKSGSFHRTADGVG